MNILCTIIIDSCISLEFLNYVKSMLTEGKQNKLITWWDKEDLKLNLLLSILFEKET